MEAAERDARVAIELLERLSEPERCRAGFFPAVRLLERLVESSVRIGGEGPYSGETIRFSHEQSMMSQPNEVSTVNGLPRHYKGELLPRTQWAYEIVACVLGLTGTDSPLPLYMVSELAQDEGPAALQRAFLDIFHNRMTALFYRGVSQYDFPAEFHSDASDPMARRALQFAGSTSKPARMPGSIGCSCCTLRPCLRGVRPRPGVCATACVRSCVGIYKRPT